NGRLPVLSTTCSVICTLLFISSDSDHTELHSFPTRRSSDLNGKQATWHRVPAAFDSPTPTDATDSAIRGLPGRNAESVASVGVGDRKSTRLNSSHVAISYAVFCLKKKRGSCSRSRRPQRAGVIPRHRDHNAFASSSAHRGRREARGRENSWHRRGRSHDKRGRARD